VESAQLNKFPQRSGRPEPSLQAERESDPVRLMAPATMNRGYTEMGTPVVLPAGSAALSECLLLRASLPAHPLHNLVSIVSGFRKEWARWAPHWPLPLEGTSVLPREGSSTRNSLSPPIRTCASGSPAAVSAFFTRASHSPNAQVLGRGPEAAGIWFQYRAVQHRGGSRSRDFRPCLKRLDHLPRIERRGASYPLGR